MKRVLLWCAAVALLPGWALLGLLWVTCEVGDVLFPRRRR